MTRYQEILTAIKAGNREGLEQLYQDYGSRFYSYALQRWQLDEDEAWEVAYKTLETLVLKLPDYVFESQAGFEGFLFKVLVNFLRQHYRSKQQKNYQELEFVDLNNEEGITGSISRQMNQQAFAAYYAAEPVEQAGLKALTLALEQLDISDRDILLLRAQHYSYDEIAALLHIDNNQLKVKHHRAKQKLINLLAQTL